jgi:hypothetical protein
MISSIYQLCCSKCIFLSYDFAQLDMLDLISFEGHLGIWSSNNPPSQKVSPLYESIDSISGIFKIYMCISLN